MKKYVLTMAMMAGALCAAMPAMAESKEARAERPHEVRIGIGDAFADKEFNGPSYYNYGGGRFRPLALCRHSSPVQHSNTGSQ